MIAKILFLALVACICKAQSQQCGCGGPGPILPGSLPSPILEIGVGPCTGPLPAPFNMPISGPCSTPMLPNNLPGLVNFQAPLAYGPLLGPISGPILAETFAKPPYLPPTLQPLSSPVVTPVTATPTNVVATTVIDNSVANSLANTLQLLIVSNLIQSTLNSGPTSCFADNVIETVTSTPIYDCVSPLPEIVSNIDFYGSSMIEPCPNFYGGITEVVTPCNVIEPFAPIYGSLPEFVTTIPGNVGPFGGISSNLYECPLPSYYGLPELNFVPTSPFNTFCGFTELASPMPPALPMQFSEVISPFSPLSLPPYFCNGVTEIVNPVTSYAPVAAEIFLPSSIPAQLKCTLSYMPASLPVVAVNIEPMPFNSFGEFGFGNGYLC